MRFDTTLGGGTAAPAAAFGQGASGTLAISVAVLAHDGGTVTLTSSAPGLTFSSVTETSATTLTANFASTSATVPGSYSLTVTDNGGTSTLAGAFLVNAAPTLTSLSAPVLPDQSPAVATVEVITGTGFTDNHTSPAMVTFTSLVNGTTLHVASFTYTSATTVGVTVTPINSITSAPATPGAYAVTVINADGGSATAGLFTVTNYGVTNVSPSALPYGVTTPGTSTPVTITGSGFESGAVVTLDTTCVTAGVTVVAANTVATSATTVTAVINNQDTATPELCNVTVKNPTVLNGGNNASYTTNGALGINQASTVAPIVTATSATTALVPGAAASVVTLTGSGFSYKSSAIAYSGTTLTPTSGVVMTNAGSNAGTSVSFLVSVAANGAAAGPSSVIVTNAASPAGDSNQFPAAFSVVGPQIVSMSPAAIATTTPIGTVITLTGTGFTNTTFGSVILHSGGSLAGLFQYVSPTTMNFVITASPNASDMLTTAPVTSLQLSQVSSGGTVLSNVFPVVVHAAPTISGITYKTGTGVGVGATAQTVYIAGTGFASGATVGTFKNGSGVADANVTATVISVNFAGTLITATVAVAAPDANIAVGYSVTNTDGGVATTTAIGFPIVIQAGPTITAVSPAAATASATNAFTITGTNFGAGAVVTTTNSGGTCGTATVVSATSITVSCTLGAAGTSAISLVVTNLNGGSATSAAVLAAKVPPVVVVSHPFSLGSVGHALRGHTATLLIKGGGFYGQPTIRSNAKGFVRGIVAVDTGTLLAVHVTVRANGAAGMHTLTIILANGKACKVNYLTK